jgi:hypothetical protein
MLGYRILEMLTMPAGRRSLWCLRRITVTNQAATGRQRWKYTLTVQVDFLVLHARIGVNCDPRLAGMQLA